MKINYINGDLLSVTEGIIMHGCNAQGVMGSGVALAIKHRYPKCFTAYTNQDRTLGSVAWYIHSNGLLIANAITQQFYGRAPKRYVSYDAVERSFTDVIVKAIDDGIFTVNLPKIGAGLGNGDWEIISTIVERTAERLRYSGSINVYEL